MCAVELLATAWTAFHIGNFNVHQGVALLNKTSLANIVSIANIADIASPAEVVSPDSHMSYPLHTSSRWRKYRSQAGVLLPGLMVGLALANLLLMVWVPRVDQEIRRRKETQLRFIQAEVRRACQKFTDFRHRQPRDLQELLCDENGQRYLRQIYLDPISKTRNWQTVFSQQGCAVHSPSPAKSLSGRPYSEF